MVAVACLLLVLAAAVLAAGIARRYLGFGPDNVWSEWVPPEEAYDDDEPGWGGGGYGGVREPRRPLPSGGAASVALPEPDDRAA